MSSFHWHIPQVQGKISKTSGTTNPMSPKTRLIKATDSRTSRVPKTTKNFSLVRSSEPLAVSIWNIEFWDPPERSLKSYLGYIAFLGGNLISWKLKKQPTVLTSTTEAEYRTLYEGVQESSQKIINTLLTIKVTYPWLLIHYFNNRLSTSISFFHWIREIHDTGLFQLTYTSTHKMKADMCTKALDILKHQKIVEDINIQQYLARGGIEVSHGVMLKRWKTAEQGCGSDDD
ncbi:uncharacterized protein VP01_2448g3 [Puccinia sorghi]|uniref:Mitochondrial protein n=1 Tax=Puccinia sorghi TaxID=27349 RepID=A0A0L6V689_9BASI|nr:uncharacterized protein VP01_2448g3 [Puccinia sorghi]